MRDLTKIIDITFDVYSDTPPGKDPDSYSQTLRRYHQTLWSKELPNGQPFNLTMDAPKFYLHHRSDKGEFALSSDSLAHTYRNTKALSSIVSKISDETLDDFFRLCSTIGGYVVFPSKRIAGKVTINGARGFNARIKDRFDLTLECIRRHYARQQSPLSETLDRYSNFFDLFDTFQGYTDFFLFDDLISKSTGEVKFFLCFDDFQGSPLPSDPEAYLHYRDNLIAFVTARNERIRRLHG